MYLAGNDKEWEGAKLMNQDQVEVFSTDRMCQNVTRGKGLVLYKKVVPPGV